MFLVLLRFSEDKSKAGRFMDAHNRWLKRGFDDQVFLVAGSLQPNRGGAILAHNTSPTDLQNRLSEDPFVAEKIVVAEILEISPSRVDERMKFLLE